MPANFTDNAAIDVASGLMLMYLMLGLMCAFANEAAASLLNLRARTLETAICAIIDIPSLCSAFYRHGLVEGCRAGNPRSHVSYISSQIFATALLASLDPEKALPSFEALMADVQKLPDSRIRDILFVNAIAAEGSLITWRNNLAQWFDQAMHRLSGAYNRRIKAIALLTGMLIAGLLNADSITISQALWHDSSLRAAMLASAYHAHLPEKTTLPELNRAEKLLRPLPLGWHIAAHAKHSFTDWLRKIAGLGMTGIAVSFGAPFWFDLLSRFTNLRNTGKKP